MRIILLVGAFVFCSTTLIAQEQISNKMTLSIEGSTTFDAEITGGGLKIDRKINKNFSVGVFSTLFFRNYGGASYDSDLGKFTTISDNGNQATYSYEAKPLDASSNLGYVYIDDFAYESRELQIGLRLKYSLFTQNATKPYLGFNIAYNNETSIKPIDQFGGYVANESIIINRLDKNNGVITSLELGVDQDLSNRFAFFVNIRATLITSLVNNKVSFEILNEEFFNCHTSVSYTHLTLPTIYSV